MTRLKRASLFSLVLAALAMSGFSREAESGERVGIMLRDVFVSLSGAAGRPDSDTEETGSVETRTTALLKSSRFPVVSETDAGIVLRVMSGSTPRDVTVPRQDVRIEEAPAPVPERTLRRLLKSLERAETRRRDAHDAFAEGLARLRPHADTVRRRQRVVMDHAALAAELAAAVSAYQELTAGLPDDSPTCHIVRDELAALLESHGTLGRDIDNLAGDIASVEQALAPLADIKSEIGRLDELLRGRKDKIDVLVNEGAAPGVLDNLARVEQNLDRIADAYRRVDPALDEIAVRRSFTRDLNSQMDGVEARQAELRNEGMALQVRISLLKELSP